MAGIVLNEETVANRDKAYWNGCEYQVVNEHYWPLEEGTVYSMEEHLPDGYCFPDLRYPEDKQGLYNDRIFHTWNEAENRYDYVKQGSCTSAATREIRGNSTTASSSFSPSPWWTALLTTRCTTICVSFSLP